MQDWTRTTAGIQMSKFFLQKAYHCHKVDKKLGAQCQILINWNLQKHWTEVAFENPSNNMC